MHASQRYRPVKSPRAGNPHRAGRLALVLVLGGGLALILYLHGASWWYGPLLVAVIVLAHLAVFGGIIFLSSPVLHGRRAPREAAPSQGGPDHSHDSDSALLHSPRLFDWMIQLHTLGRERQLRAWMLDLADLEPGNAVLDVGSGTGTLLLAAAERVGPSGALHGIEPSAEMTARARQKAEARHVPLEIVEGSAGSLPYPPASFDAVFCVLVLHHLPVSMRDGAIREMRRVLRRGGRAVIIDWQRPKCVVSAITGGLFLASMLHHLQPGASPPNTLEIEPLMNELGFEDVTRRPFGGGVLGAVVGRLGPRTGSIDQAEPQASTRPLR